MDTRKSSLAAQYISHWIVFKVDAKEYFVENFIIKFVEYPQLILIRQGPHKIQRMF